MTQIYLGIGSNINRETSIQQGLKALKLRYGKLKISPVYESKAYGFDGDDFFNLVIGFENSISIDKLDKHLKEIEHQSGRDHTEPRYRPRTLDIDLLLYGDLVSGKYELPRADVLKYAFVLKPLCDLAPELIHPTEKKSIELLWQTFDDPQQQLTKASELAVY